MNARDSGHIGSQSSDARVTNALMMIRVRWMAGVGLILGAIAGHLLGVVLQPAALLAIGVVVLGYNAVLHVLASRLTAEGKQTPRAFWLSQLAADVAALTGIVFFCGGIENPVVVLYVIIIISAAAVLPTRDCYLLACFAGVCLAVVAVGQAAFPQLYHPLGFGFAGQYFDKWSFVGIHTTVLTVCMFAGAYFRGQSREIRRISAALRISEREMVQHEKMVAIGTMAAGVAHEVGNPLACLSSLMQLMKRRPLAEEDRDRVKMLEEQVERISVIIRELLEFARPGGGERVVADLDEVVEGVIKLARYSHRFRDAEIISVRNGGFPMVRIVPQHIQQVMVNLLLNAFDAVAEQEGEAVVTVSRIVKDGWVSVKVADKGVGMSEEETRQAFEPFYTTKAPGEGTGLGLAVSYGLVEQSGGRITIQSLPGEGTVVTISFPAVDEAPGEGALRVGV